jgi:hypothetical protein
LDGGGVELLDRTKQNWCADFDDDNEAH